MNKLERLRAKIAERPDCPVAILRRILPYLSKRQSRNEGSGYVPFVDVVEFVRRVGINPDAERSALQAVADAAGLGHVSDLDVWEGIVTVTAAREAFRKAIASLERSAVPA